MRLKEARIASRMTQKEVAQLMGINQNTYSYWESGKTRIDNISLGKLASIFGVSVDYLLDKTSTPAGENDEIPDSYSSELLHFANQLNPKLKERLMAVALILLAEQKGQSVLLESNNGGNRNE